MVIGSSIILILLGIRGFNQAGTWSDALALYEHGASVAPDSAVANNNCAVVLLQRNRFAEATPYAAHAVAIEPGNRSYRRNYALALGEEHRWLEMIEQLEIMQKSEASAETVQWLNSLMTNTQRKNPASRPSRWTLTSNPHRRGP